VNAPYGAIGIIV